MFMLLTIDPKLPTQNRNLDIRIHRPFQYVSYNHLAIRSMPIRVIDLQRKPCNYSHTSLQQEDEVFQCQPQVHLRNVLFEYLRKYEISYESKYVNK